MKNKNRLDYQAQLSRHDHDISAGYFHTLSTGMIIPQYFHILGPGDSIYYSNHLFARLQNVVTAFRGEIDIHLESFFVPLQMIYTPFGQIFAQTDDYLTSLYHNLSERQGFPLIPFDDEHGAGTGEHYPAARPIDTFAGHIECVGKEYTRLLDAFDMNPFHACKWAVPASIEPIDPQLCYMPSCSPWIPAAYQAIYQKCFRNDEFERFSIADYNIDQYYNTGWVINDRIMRLRYVQRPADYFTTARVSPIASAVNKIGGSAGSDSDLFPSDGGRLTSLLTKVDSFLIPSNSVYNYTEFGQPSTYANANQYSFDATGITSVHTSPVPGDWTAMAANNIRVLFAVDKFARIYGRADKTYDDQILAHFGVKIPHDVKHDLTRLKHWHVVLQSDPIYGTANIVDGSSELISTIGQVGAQGQCDLNTEQEKFTAPVHGVFMIVAYAVTKPRYFGTFSKLHFLGGRLSFPIPEFDKLGAQPLYSFETDPSVLYELNADDGGTSPSPTRIAWQNRYQEFKKKYNRISLTYMDPQEIHEHTPSGTHINVFAPWALSRVPFRGLQNAFNVSQLMPGTAFWERPNALNVVMEVPYDSRWSNDYYSNPHRMFETDPIIMDYMCNAKLVSWMSETGEPDL